jgi:YVTN family beta-propeller protein
MKVTGGAIRVAVVAAALLRPFMASALPAPGKLLFMNPTPAESSMVTTTTASIRLDAVCTLDTNSLAVNYNGTPVPASSFLPFSACTNGRMQSQTATVSVTLPNSTITGGPTSLNAGQSGNYTGSGTGSDTLNWNFDGGAAPATGSSVSATFKPAGAFTVRLQATKAQQLDASAMDQGNLVTAQRAFTAGDPSPATRAVAVAMPPEVDFRNFETALTHPLQLSAAGDKLYAVNTVESRLAIFDVAGDGSLSFSGDVPVGLDPVSVAVRPSSNEVWVTNHLSDTVSVVDVSTRKIVDTIAVGDEPTDVVFASGRAFVSLAGNQDRVKVYNASTRALLTTLNIGDGVTNFGDDPRALAANAAGTEVYAVMLESGNQSTTLFEDLVSAGGGPPAPNPPRSGSLGPAPAVGLIVQFNGSNWVDETNDIWNSFIDYNLPDQDVFVIDADAGTPSVIRRLVHVGTTLFDVAVQPGTGDLWVPNTDARNLVRFEPKLRGHLVQTRVTVVDPVTGVQPPFIDLNTHINYNVTPGPPAEIAASLANPVTGIFNGSGSTYYVAGMGSQKVGVVNAGTGNVDDLIAVGDGPSGLALNEADARLYVLNRFDNTISTVNTSTNTEIVSARIGVSGPKKFDPSPDVIKIGRKFLYDGQLTSGHGDTACATCHLFANFDNLAWELGDPQGAFLDYDNAPWVTFFLLNASQSGFDPQKGPMTTQTLRGLDNMEPFHWRGDRQNFQAFNHAFIVLMGMGAEIPAADMDRFTDFIMTVKFPPNPFRNLDNTMPSSITVPSQSGGGATATGNPNNGLTAFQNNTLDAGALTCNQCHLLPTGTRNELFNGAQEGESQDFKIPHMRNMYEKVGFDVIRPQLQGGNGNNIGLTNQKKGFGFIHDGSVSLTEFLAAPVFTSTTQQERDLFAFALAFPTETFPAVGRQQLVTDTNKNDSTVISTINTLIAQAEASACDVIAKGTFGGTAKGYVYDRNANNFVPDTLNEAAVTEAALRGSVQPGDVLTYMGVPAGAGSRMGIDRDRDQWPDRTEVALGFDPADPNSNPWGNN